MLPSYYNHVQAHDNTMITKFYGIHEITPRGGKKVSNMFSAYSGFHVHVWFANADGISKHWNMRFLSMACLVAKLMDKIQLFQNH